MSVACPLLLRRAVSATVGGQLLDHQLAGLDAPSAADGAVGIRHPLEDAVDGAGVSCAHTRVCKCWACSASESGLRCDSADTSLHAAAAVDGTCTEGSECTNDAIDGAAEGTAGLG